MAEKTPAEKLRLKPGMKAAILHVPDGLWEYLGVPAGVALVEDPAAADFLLEFAEDQARAEKRLTALRPAVGDDTVAWLAYPKGSKAAGRDISRDTIWAFVQTLGMRLVANVAIDGTWSAVRMKVQR
jgi:hypothetical protein